MIRMHADAMHQHDGGLRALGRRVQGKQAMPVAGLQIDRIAYQWSTEVSVYVDPARHRGGLGRALYTALFRVLVLQGYANTYAGVTLPNAASVGLHEALGFKPVGVYRRIGWKLGAWRDVGWWQRELAGADDAPPRAPGPPVRLAQSSSSSSASVGQTSTARRASPTRSGGTSESSRIG